jgi:hypothetical protein
MTTLLVTDSFAKYINVEFYLGAKWSVNEKPDSTVIGPAVRSSQRTTFLLTGPR